MCATVFTWLRRLVFHFVSFVAVVAIARADIYTVRREGAAIYPQQSTSVSMDAEDVVLQRGPDGFAVTATFVMRNQSDQRVDSAVAFPIVGSGYYPEWVFIVEVAPGSGEDVVFERVLGQVRYGADSTVRREPFATEPPKSAADFPEAIVWDMSWRPGETKTIRLHFDMGDPKVLRGSNELAAGWQVMYIVSTGALWKGPIGRADISIRFDGGREWWPGGLGSFREWSYPDQAKWEGEESISWHFENWTPTEEIWLRSVEWVGLTPEGIDNYTFWLPEDYLGATTTYSETHIDRQVERELEFAREYFPEKASTFDPLPLRVAISDWLLHEIYARHGDLFVVGGWKSGEPLPAGTVGDDKGNLLSSWYLRFSRYAWHGGWYQPRRFVKTKSLTKLEQTNVAFLRSHLADLREKLGPAGAGLLLHTPGEPNVAR